MTDKLRAAAEMALEALEDTLALCINYKSVEDADGYVFTEASDVIKQGESAHKALRQALDQLPDTTKMIDTGTDRGAWSDVPDATKWVDELRGDDEEWTPEDTAYRSGGLSVEEPPNSTTSVEEPVGEIVEAHGLIAVSIPKMPPVGTKLYTAPPKREWQWLTYSELQEIMDSMKTLNSYDITDIYVAVEAKLREKNHG